MIDEGERDKMIIVVNGRNIIEGEKLGTLTTDRLVQRECLIWCRLIKARMYYILTTHYKCFGLIVIQSTYLPLFYQ